MSINASTDLRSRRTRKWLGDALLSLMQEKPFRAIQITEITDRAEVSRPAFYLHYRSKEELLFSYVDAGFEEFHTEFSKEVAAGNIDLQKFCVLLFQYWEKNANILQMVIAADLPQILMQRLRGHFEIFVAELAGSERKSEQDIQRQEFVIDYVAGGTYLLLTKWISNGRPASPEQMGQILFNLTLPCESFVNSKEPLFH